MNLDHIQKCIELLEKCSLKRIVIKEKEFELELEKFSSDEPQAIKHTVKAVPQQAIPSPKPEVKEGQYVSSPMVGTFYEASAPDQPSFVKVGDRVDEKTTVCVVEAMKVMNEVKAGVKGIVEEILVNNAEPVEFGTKLFRVK